MYLSFLRGQGLSFTHAASTPQMKGEQSAVIMDVLTNTPYAFPSFPTKVFVYAYFICSPV